MAISRRNFIVAASAAGGGVALSPFEASQAAAQTPVSKVENSGFHRFQFGDFEITTLSDGRRAGEAPEKTYAIDQDPKDVAALLEENLLPTDRFVNSFTPVLINTGKELVLFDTGMGAGAREAGQGKLISALEASGYKAGDVSLVVLSHFHPDHIGGLMEDGKPAFANARYAAGQREFDFWTDPARLESPAKTVAQMVEKNVKPLAEKTTFIDDGKEVVPGIHAIGAYGHTPGHLAFRVESDGKSLMLISDTANHSVITLQRPDWHVSFDIDKDMAVETRKRIFDMIATDRLPFIGYHMPFPSLAYLQREGEGYRYVPETYQIRNT
ncbi:MBL fold hydrolase [Ochrobactrum sp. MYb15]|uniref:MBL fold metallo-hydrolase n=1 Tax=Brucella TaxID=234 RepID=UPI000467D20F|nr:MBL fold metallo-hydrolase [Brucella rhizosphaerae]PQZ47082.1 MBL fold hydrolase [Ochrobactrum sp. MYb19]PRA61674.1 MBL fold hydrolase [Ochrobactrum sp. MYb18]PRA76490.1 MBL fold hydrolase [Brucella thiophenivorans]PRA85787.1 MBL fold hydrolase [Ochrobactrum sp. MYb14]PRA98495.1 MBL fold hydrolase [Ochrobactrum sp. MYb15]